MFITALFVTANVLKQPERPSVEKWVKSCGTFTQWGTMQQ